MLAADPFFALPRTTRPADWFERILPTLPLRLPQVTMEHAIVYHVLGAGGGTWSVRLDEGRLLVFGGRAPLVLCQLSMTAAHLREAIAGSLRERFKTVLQRQGRPPVVPDLSQLPHDPARVVAAAALQGSIACEIVDRDYDDRYRYVVTFGPGQPAYDQATTTVEVDADDLVTLAGARTPPWQVLVSGKLRVRGDAGLPGRVLAAVFGA